MALHHFVDQRPEQNHLKLTANDRLLLRQKLQLLLQHEPHSSATYLEVKLERPQRFGQLARGPPNKEGRRDAPRELP
jgi:hypothetical protein